MTTIKPLHVSAPGNLLEQNEYKSNTLKNESLASSGGAYVDVDGGCGGSRWCRILLTVTPLVVILLYLNR